MYQASALRRPAMQNRLSVDAMCDTRTVMCRGIDAASSASEPDSLRQHATLDGARSVQAVRGQLIPKLHMSRRQARCSAYPTWMPPEDETHMQR